MGSIGLCDNECVDLTVRLYQTSLQSLCYDTQIISGDTNTFDRIITLLKQIREVLFQIFYNTFDMEFGCPVEIYYNFKGLLYLNNFCFDKYQFDKVLPVTVETIACSAEPPSHPPPPTYSHFCQSRLLIIYLKLGGAIGKVKGRGNTI